MEITINTYHVAILTVFYCLMVFLAILPAYLAIDHRLSQLEVLLLFHIQQTNSLTIEESVSRLRAFDDLAPSESNKKEIERLETEIRATEKAQSDLVQKLTPQAGQHRRCSSRSPLENHPDGR